MKYQFGTHNRGAMEQQKFTGSGKEISFQQYWKVSKTEEGGHKPCRPIRMELKDKSFKIDT